MPLRLGRNSGGQKPPKKQSEGEKAAERPSRRTVVKEYARSIGLAVGVALLLRAFVVEAYMVPSGSMIPTLQIGDHLMANKFIYGLTVPFTTYKLIDGRSPHIGEVVIFTHPKTGETLIKRVVGLGGDTISMVHQVLYRNGKPAKRTELAEKCRYPDEDDEDESIITGWEPCHAYNEHLGEVVHPVYYNANRSWLDFPPTKVPAGNIFVMGDNRDNSGDSRIFGPVPLTNVKGKAMFFWWSRGPDGIRWKRMFRPVR